MIRRIASSLATFKELEFGPGLNILLAKKESAATEKQTRNRAGKSSLIEIVHFLTGAKVEKDSLFGTEPLLHESFEMTMELGGKTITVRRSGAEKSKVHLEADEFPAGRKTLSNAEWVAHLGNVMFGLDKLPDTKSRPTFRSLFAYFVRRQGSGAFTEPVKQSSKQQTSDYQMALLYLLGLDWQIASDWQNVRDQEKTLRELRKVAGDGTLGTLVGKASDLRTMLTVAQASLDTMQAQLAKFQVLPQYAALESEADRLTRQISDLSNANVIDVGAIRELERAMAAEAPPPLTDLERIYAEAGVALPGVAIKRYGDVQAFHESVVRNRIDYLEGELIAANERVQAREKEKKRLDDRRAEVMNLLNTHGALDQFSKLQAEGARKEAEVESLRRRFAAAEQLEGTKNQLEIERNQLALRLRRDFMEREESLSEAILAFEETSKRLYESAGSMTVEPTSNGPDFAFPMQGSRSKGIKNMQIFCFDMMLMRLCGNHGLGPGFLIHDSHLFDGVDGRQVLSALRIGSETAAELGFQYIVTMNEDDIFKESTTGFNVREYVLPVVLTDAQDDGGLFGFRF